MIDYNNPITFLGIINCVFSMVACPIIASKKGKNPVGWFFLGFAFGLIAFVIICCKEAETSSTYLPYQVERRRSYVCPSCKREYFISARVCPHCGEDIQKYKKEHIIEIRKKTWFCESCGFKNSEESCYCGNCFKEK